MIIEQKTLKVDKELEVAQALEKDTSKNIQNMNTKLDLLGAKLFKTKQTHAKDVLESQHIRLELLDKFRVSMQSFWIGIFGA